MKNTSKQETSDLFTEVHLHQEGYVSVEVPTKGGLSRRATCLTQFTTKVNRCSLRKLHKGGVIQLFPGAPHGEGTQR
jgi:hypothetical protein